jgi:hypothetical protein
MSFGGLWRWFGLWKNKIASGIKTQISSQPASNLDTILTEKSPLKALKIAQKIAYQLGFVNL